MAKICAQFLKLAAVLIMPVVCIAPGEVGAASPPEADPRVRWSDAPVPLPDFSLTDDQGRAFGLSDLRGRTALMFFGFTNCRDVCPATIQVLQQVHRSLGDASRELVCVFVSVDGARDTPAVVHEYLKPFRSSFIGLTGETGKVRVFADKLPAVFFKGMPTGNNGYDVEHTSQVYLIDPHGRLRATFYGAGVETIGAATRTILAEGS